MSEIKLTCHRVKYYAPIDEDMFFKWIKKIKSIKSFEGILYDLHLYLDSSELPRKDYFAIKALFKRYNIDLKQLDVLTIAPDAHSRRLEKEKAKSKPE